MAEILVIGGGGREHALATKLASSPLVHRVLVCPGNAGTGRTPNVQNCSLNVKDHEEVVRRCLEWGISLVVIGPEDPLADGLGDSLEMAGIKVFGPKKNAARIESSKAWAKDFMKRHSIPTAQYECFTDMVEAQDFIKKSSWEGFAIKASGLAGGKGVSVVDNKDLASSLLRSFMVNQNSKPLKAYETLVIEEKLSGFEISVLAFSDGTTIRVMPPAQDHKQRFGGGHGPNTGGMGAYCPCPLVSEKDLEFIAKNMIQKTVEEMRKEGCPYIGVLYAGIMITDDGPKVLEFNCRFGDPETQALMLLLKSDLYTIMVACAEGSLGDLPPIEFSTSTFAVAQGVVIASYPGDVQKGLGLEIEGMDSALQDPSISIFMAGVKETGPSGTCVTAGGRVLSICVTGRSLEAAVAKALEGASKVSFREAPRGYGPDLRADIALQAIIKFREEKNTKLSYKEAGVNIEEGNLFVKKIGKFCEETRRPGVRSDLGMFGAVFDTKLEGYKNPLLVSGTDGVGTKLKLAIEQNSHETVGQDLVAMCVNDILAHAAEPLFFLDYMACGKLESNSKAKIVNGISKACLVANCSLVGGETAEMPGMYRNNDYDLAGFAVGAVEEGQMLPKLDQMKLGNLLIGVTSSGLHSNGFSLVRKVIEMADLQLNNEAPFNLKKTLGNELLKPTHLYTPLLQVLRSGLILGAAHITGGGIEENLVRVIPEWASVQLDATWEIPSVFSWLYAQGIPLREMLRTFNLGLGLVLIVEKKNEETVTNLIENIFRTKIPRDECATYPQAKWDRDTTPKSCWTIGFLSENTGRGRFSIKGLAEALYRSCGIIQDTYPASLQLTARKRVAVLISGTGTNLQALLDYTMSGPSMAEIVLVISNVEGAEGLQKAAKAMVPTSVVSHKKYSKREDFDSEVDRILESYNIEIVCLAGFMRILSTPFVRKWKGKLLNIHPSLLPSFKGKDAQKQALEAGVCVSGCTVHLVSEEVDAGAIIDQAAVPVFASDDITTLSERIKQTEHKIYPRALETMAREKLYIDDEGNCRKIVRG